MTITNKSGFPTFEAARNELRSLGFTAAGPYAKEWKRADSVVAVIGSGLRGKTGQSARGLSTVFGYYQKVAA